MSALAIIKQLKYRLNILSEWAMYKDGIGKVHMNVFIREVSDIEESINAELLALRAELTDAKARAAAAEKGWHANEARIGKLQQAIKSALGELERNWDEDDLSELHDVLTDALKGAA